MGISDTTVEAGSDKRHHNKRHHSKHHSKHKQGHHGNDSSSDHKPKHKHRHHKHHHHKHHSHKKHRHKTKVALDEAAIQSALEILEADALEAVKDQVATELNPETVELMLAACTSESTSEDSSSSSESEGEEGRKTTTAETTTLRIREVLASNTQQQSPLSDSIPSGQTDSGTTLAREPSPPVSCEDVIGTGNAVQEERRSSSKRESDSESDSEDESESGATFGAPKPTSERRNSKTIQIKIHRTKLPGKEEESYSNSVPSSPQELKSKENTDRDSESLNNRDRETKSITTGSSKITYVNLKAKKLDSDSRKAGRGSGGEKRKAAASDDSGDERPRSSSPEGRQQDRERRNRSSKRRSSRHRRSSSVSVSRSRSRSQSPHAGRHRHRSHRYRSKSRSRSRPRSSHSRRRSSRYRRSRSRSRSRSRRHRRSRSRSYIRHSSRSRSRSRSHSRSRRRYSCSSSRRRSPRRRHSYHHHSRSRSPYRSRRRRYSSRSRSRSRRSRSYSRSRSKSHSRSSSRGRNRDGEKPASEASVVKAISTAAAAIEATVADLKDPKKAHIAQLTAFCQELQEKQAREWEEGEEEEGGGAEPESEVRAPFELNPTPAYQPGLIFHNNAWKTANQIAAEMDAHIDEKPVEEKFPVSSGLPHKSTTGGIPDTQSVNAFTRLQPVSVGDLVVKRLEATRKVQQNPADYEAHRTLAEIEQQTQQWAQSKLKPGRFTGQASLTAMSMKEHNTGQQAWAKKDMFLHLAPVMGGFGMKMLKKMGWQEGQPLGKMGEGHVEPIAVQVKVNRSGLSSVADKQPPVIPAAALQSVSARGAHLVQGKHPVSALQEICAKKKWDPPHYEMVDVAGPAHKKTFLFRVTVPLGTFQPAVASNNKKVAKAQAALAALQGLGLSSGSVEYSAS